MVSLTESTAVFDERAALVGLPDESIRELKDKGLNTLAKLAFAAGQPGDTPTEGSLRRLVTHDGEDPANVSMGVLSSIRRLTFEAQTLMVSQLRAMVECKEDDQGLDMAPAERAERIRRQRDRLGGLELVGELECGHVCYEHVAKMLQANAVSYLAPHLFISRKAELTKHKPKRELVLDHGSHVVVKERGHDWKCDTSTDLLLQQALHRRSLAMDLVGGATFKVCEAYHRFLMSHLQADAPPGYQKVGISQVLRADQEAWVRLAEKTPDGIRRTAAGVLPLDTHIPHLETDPRVVFHLLPLPALSAAPSNSSGGPHLRPTMHGKSDGKADGKGWNKGGATKKRKWRAPQNTPAPLKDKQHQTSAGKPLCWNFNLERGCSEAKAGACCKKGYHLCMEPGCQQAHPLHKHKYN